MDINVSTPLAKDIHDRLTPEDHLIFQCLSCMTYLLPGELHKFSRRIPTDMNFPAIEVIFQCPACYPRPYYHEGVPVQSNFEKLTREKYEERYRYEKAGLIKLDDSKISVL